MVCGVGREEGVFDGGDYGFAETLPFPVGAAFCLSFGVAPFIEEVRLFV